MNFLHDWFSKKMVLGFLSTVILLVAGGIAWYKFYSTPAASSDASIISSTNPPIIPKGANEQVIARARKIMDLLNLARKEISDQQDYINDPNIGYKGITGESIKKIIIPRYQNIYHEKPNSPELQVLLESLMEYIDSQQDNINRKGVGFKAFFPAVFFRVSANNFNEKMAGKMHLKLTAPYDLLRNPLNKPDSWESSVLEEKFRDPSWPKGKGYAEVTNFKGQKAYRIMIPEYYAASCLICHGEPKGELDISGGKKEGKKLGELDGAVSLSIILDTDKVDNSK